MFLNQLLERARHYPLFGVSDCRQWFPNTSPGTLLVQLTNYVRRGYLLRLKRGLYLLKREPWPHPFVLAARLQPEAVISLETVLAESGLIPETILAVTALTPRRNTNFAFPGLGSFVFRHLKPALLFGWRLEQYPPYSVRVAHPEKALLDWLWFHARERDPAAYLAGLRLSFPPSFSWPRFRKFAGQFSHPRLQALARLVEKKHHR